MNYILNKLEEKGITLILVYSFSGFGTFKNEILEELKNAKTMILNVWYTESN